MQEKKTNEITFEEAYSYVLHLCKLFNITEIAKRVGISRNTLAAVINGTSDRYGKPTTLPEKHVLAITEFVKSIQIEAVRNDMPLLEPPVTKFKKHTNSRTVQENVSLIA